MTLPRIYADFNAIEYPSNTAFAEIRLTGFGTLSSLAKQNIRLREGLVVVLFEPNDIECEATVQFDRSRTDPAGRPGEWIARFDPQSVRDVSQTSEPRSNEHPCIVCGKPFFGEKKGRMYNDTCVN